jgi:hypothetical protein
VRNVKITWKNGREDDRFVSQFSMNLHGIFEMTIVSLIVLLGLIGVCTALYCRLRKDETDLAHHVLMVVLVAMCIQVTPSPLLRELHIHPHRKAIQTLMQPCRPFRSSR